MPKIKDIPKIERPREKLEKYGPEKLSNAELLAILLRTGVKGLNVIELSKKILKEFPKEKIVNITVRDLKSVFGLGSAKASEIVAFIELGKRLLKDKESRLIMSPIDVWENLKDIRDHKKEHFIIFYLNSRNQEIQREIISIGTLNANLIHPREVFEPAVKNLCSHIIIAHNHPSGNSEPSEEDIEITKRLVEAGKILGIEIVDHIVVSKNDYRSIECI